MAQFDDIAERFTTKMLQEYDYKYGNPEIPLNKAFFPDVVEVIEVISHGNAYGILKELGADIYKTIKTKLAEHYINKYKTEINKPYILLKRGDFVGIRETIKLPHNSGITVIRGEDKDTTILQAGKLRPLFKIDKGSFLILMDLIIEYEGSPKGLIEEETAPSFLPINIIFRKRTN